MLNLPIDATQIILSMSIKYAVWILSNLSCYGIIILIDRLSRLIKILREVFLNCLEVLEPHAWMRSNNRLINCIEIIILFQGTFLLVFNIAEL